MSAVMLYELVCIVCVCVVCELCIDRFMGCVYIVYIRVYCILDVLFLLRVVLLLLLH